MKKILIIKLGHCETLDKRHSTIASLGDVLRTTFLLRYFKKAEVCWMVDEKALPLLKRNDHIAKIFTYDQRSRRKLEKEKYHAVLNFEKSPDICRLSDSLNSKYHFGFSRSRGKAHDSFKKTSIWRD